MENVIEAAIAAIENKENDSEILAAKTPKAHIENGCGYVFEEKAESVAAAMKAARLDWNVISKPLYYDNPVTNEKDIVSGRFANVREDTGKVLGVVSDRYGIVSNAMGFEVVDLMMHAGEAHNQISIETAGCLRGGAEVFISAKFPNKYRINTHDDDGGIDDYILFRNTHDGSGTVMVLFTPIKVICQNTLSAAMKKAKNKVSFRHTSYVGDRLSLVDANSRQNMFNILALHEDFKKEFEENMQYLREKKLPQGFSDKDIIAFVSKVVCDEAQQKVIADANFSVDLVSKDLLSTQKRNVIKRVADTIESGIGQQYDRGTAAWLWNGVTCYSQNVKDWHGDAEKKFSSITDGPAQDMSVKAHSIVMAM